MNFFNVSYQIYFYICNYQKKSMIFIFILHSCFLFNFLKNIFSSNLKSLTENLKIKQIMNLNTIYANNKNKDSTRKKKHKITKRGQK